MSHLLFLNLPVSDVAASRGFFAGLGFGFNENFSNEEVACMEVNDQAWVMMISHGRFGDFAPKPIADAQAETAHLIAFSAESRAAVDEFIRLAIEAGAEPAGEPEDEEYMYGRGFHDLDGHGWNVFWMDPAAAEQGPADMESTA